MVVLFVTSGNAQNDSIVDTSNRVILSFGAGGNFYNNSKQSYGDYAKIQQGYVLQADVLLPIASNIYIALEGGYAKNNVKIPARSVSQTDFSTIYAGGGLRFIPMISKNFGLHFGADMGVLDYRVSERSSTTLFAISIKGGVTIAKRLFITASHSIADPGVDSKAGFTSVTMNVNVL